MPDVNDERASHEARESVGNRPPREGENRVESAMRRYLGAEMFDELHPRPLKRKASEVAPEEAPEKVPEDEGAPETSGKAGEEG
jgi:hypothetical protein